MNKLLVVLLLLLATVMGASAAPACVNGGSYASYVSLGLTGCMWNDLLFSNFGFSATGSGVGQAIASSAVSVTLVVGNNDRGLNFNGAFSLNGISTGASANLTYTLSYIVTAPAAYLKGVTVDLRNVSVDTESATAPNSGINFTKGIKDATGCTGTFAACGGGTVNTPAANLTSTDTTNNGIAVTNALLSITKSPFTTGLMYSTLFVNDQLTLTASRNASISVKGNAQLTDMDDLFVTPEPGTGSLLGGAIGLGLLLAGRFRRNR